jgi:ribonucleotide monophosphatase NagD (HAD superfamily)
MAAFADHFDGYILDLWGVLHDGVTAFPQALDCLTFGGCCTTA